MGVFRDAMERAMALRGFAPKTCSAYLSWVRRLIQFCRVVPDQLTNEHVRAFLLHLTQERKLSFSTFNQALNAARFFFLEVLKRPFVVEGLRYQKPPRRLPVVMNDEEVSRLLAAAVSLRDRALLETAYATGMRVSEVTRLLITDLDSGRMAIRVDQGKGRKDRYVMLSPSLLETLRAYWRESKPKGFLFPGVGGNEAVVHLGGAEGLRSGQAPGGDQEAGVVPHAQAQLRDPPDRERHERAYDPGSARSPQPADHGALHALGAELPSPDHRALSIDCERRYRHRCSSWRTARRGALAQSARNWARSSDNTRANSRTSATRRPGSSRRCPRVAPQPWEDTCSAAITAGARILSITPAATGTAPSARVWTRRFGSRPRLVTCSPSPTSTRSSPFRTA